MNSSHSVDDIGVASAVLTMAPSTVTGSPPEYFNIGRKSDRNGTAPTFTSNSLTSLPSDEITCRTTPMVDTARAARCILQNQSYCAACSGVLHVERPARKKGDDRNSCVFEYRSSHVPDRYGGMMVVVDCSSFSVSCTGALDSRSATSCDASSFWDGLAYCPLSVDAAMRRMEFSVAALLSTVAAGGVTAAGSMLPLAEGAVTVASAAFASPATGVASLASFASSNER
mmetsp:Transcript_3849/g.9813  ORF Transcript_3849/g.9813 Transcript_3849/m.9813 type:complete len:228 (-) Transcript_3849:96-779(-)